MLDVLPPEIILLILCYLPIQQLQRLSRVSKPWRCFIDVNKEDIFHAAAILHGFIPPQTKTIDSAPVPKKWSEDIHTWSELCHKFYKTHLRWEGQESSYSSHVGTAGKAVWRFKIDEEQETVITTHFDGGLRVAPIESSGSDMLWLLPHSEVNGYAHVEFTDGFVVFTRRGEIVDVWRRKRDVKHLTSRPSTLYNDFVQLRARRTAWQSDSSVLQDDRGAFVPWTVISPPNSTRALRAVHSKLLLASQVAGEAYLYDLVTGKLIQSIQFRTREDPVVDVNYVDFSQRHAFICTHSDILIFPLDPSDTSTLLRFPTGVAGISEVFLKATYCLKYSDTGNPIYATNAEDQTSLLMQCVVAKEAPSDSGIWHCNAVHVSPCGSHFVAADAAGNICIVRDFERALRNGTPLRDNITIVNVGYPIMYLAYDDDHRIAVYVDDRGVFVLPHIINVTVPIKTCTMEPTRSEDMVVLHVQQNLYSGLVQLCSCLQLTKSELWYSWTRMHTRPELGIANNVLRRIDFSQPSEPPPRRSPYTDPMMEVS